MEENNASGFDPFDGQDAPVQELTGESVSTETIDLSSLFTQDLYSSGTFDLSDVGSTALGRLLDALPMPAVVIDQQNRLWFTNKSCAGISPAYRKMQGAPFLDFIARPSDTAKARALSDKVLGLFDRVFATRKPQIAETILEIHKTRMWVRLHLRAIRIGSRRHLLGLIEDLTHEKRQIELNRRREEEFRKALRDIETQLHASRGELSATSELHRGEVTDHLQTRIALQVERQKYGLLSEQAPLATAVVAPTGAVQDISRRFSELTGYELEDLPNLRDLVTSTESENHPWENVVSTWPERFDQPCEDQQVPTSCHLMCRDATKKAVNMRGWRLADGAYFITCQDREERDREDDIT